MKHKGLQRKLSSLLCLIMLTGSLFTPADQFVYAADAEETDTTSSTSSKSASESSSESEGGRGIDHIHIHEATRPSKVSLPIEVCKLDAIMQKHLNLYFTECEINGERKHESN